LLATKLSPSVDAIAEAADEVRKRAKADKSAIDKLTKVIEQLATATTQAETRVQAVALEGSKAEQVFVRLADIAEKFDQAASSAKANLDYTHKVIQAQENLQTKAEDSLSEAHMRLLGGTKDAAARQEEVLRKIEQSLSETVLRVKQHNDGLAAELERSKQYTTKVHSALVSMSEALTEKVTS
jgi:predicted  nucleic acid-binding Zn-ribbon protein